MNGYFVMAGLYGMLALLALVDSALGGLGLASPLSGLSWLRVHLVTLGVVLEVAFALLPGVRPMLLGKPRPPFRWAVWVPLNLGIPVLLVGIPTYSPTLIAVGGTLILLAVALLLAQLFSERVVDEPSRGPSGRPFYLASLLYLLWGAFLGTGLWLGWGEALAIAAPKEVHVHANLWGFASLLMAGLLVDVYPSLTGRSLAWPRLVPVTFWLMTAGALGLVLGPWLALNLATLLGLVLHTSATILLLANVIRPLAGTKLAGNPGMWHILLAYWWQFVTVIAAPLVVLRPSWFPADRFAEQGSGILIYGWLFPFAFAVVPYLVTRWLRARAPAQLGGNWLSLAAVQAGTVAYIAGMYYAASRDNLQGLAFALWAIAIGVIAVGVWRAIGPDTAEPEKTRSVHPERERI